MSRGYGYLTPAQVVRSYHRRRIVGRGRTGVETLECGHRHRPARRRTPSENAAVYRFCSNCPRLDENCACGHVRALHTDSVVVPGCRICRCRAFTVSSAA